MFRYYTEEDGRRVYKRQYVGTVLEFPKRKDAEKAITQLRVEINEGAQCAPMNVEQLAAYYKKDELPRKAYATVVSYTDFLNSHIVPKWGASALSAIKSIDVEKWLEGINRKDGNPTSPSTKAKHPQRHVCGVRPRDFATGGHRITRSQRSGRHPRGCAIRNFSRQRSCRHCSRSSRNVSAPWSSSTRALEFAEENSLNFAGGISISRWDCQHHAFHLPQCCRQYQDHRVPQTRAASSAHFGRTEEVEGAVRLPV